MDEIFDLVRNAFHSLWKVKHYGNTIEIVTPSFTTNDCFVSVFLNGVFTTDYYSIFYR